MFSAIVIGILALIFVLAAVLDCHTFLGVLAFILAGILILDCSRLLKERKGKQAFLIGGFAVLAIIFGLRWLGVFS